MLLRGILLLWLLAVFAIPARAALVAAEYYLDIDPGEGLATPVALTASNTVNSSFANLTMPAGLAPGVHTVGVRVQDDQGRWSTPVLRRFRVAPAAGLTVPPPSALALEPTIAQAEYFVDSDPGEGNGTSIPIEAAASHSAWLSSVSLGSTFTPGVHTVGVRVQDEQGAWSAPILHRFTVQAASGLAVAPATTWSLQPTIDQAEYYINVDPGKGNGNPVSIAAASTYSALLSALSLEDGLAPGFHTVGLRVRNTQGAWSHPLLRRVQVIAADELVVAPPSTTFGRVSLPQYSVVSLIGMIIPGQTYSITILGETITLQARQYERENPFIRRLAAVINAHPILSREVYATVAGSAQLGLTALEAKAHPADWVTTSAHLSAELIQQGVLGADQRRVVAMEYFLDTEPLPGQGIPIPLIHDTDFTASFTNAVVTTTGSRAGTHEVGVRTKNAAGQWSNPIYQRFTTFALVGGNDTNAPVISLSGDPERSWPHAVPYIDPGYGATDDIDGDLSSEVVVEGTVDADLPGTYSLHYRVHDLAGNLTETTRVVYVYDTDPPEIQGDLNMTYNTAPATIDLFAGLAANDPQYGDLSHQIELISSDVDWFNAGEYEAQFRVTDYAGWSTQVVRSVSIQPGALFYPSYTNWITPRALAMGALGADMDPAADPDNDGYRNHEEWLAETDPFDELSYLYVDYLRTAGEEHFGWYTEPRINYQLIEYHTLAPGQSSMLSTMRGQGTYTNAVVPVDPQALRRYYRIQAEPVLPIEQP